MNRKPTLHETDEQRRSDPGAALAVTCAGRPLDGAVLNLDGSRTRRNGASAAYSMKRSGARPGAGLVLDPRALGLQARKRAANRFDQ